MSDTAPVRVLVADGSENDAEILVSLLRNAGLPIRAQYVPSMPALDQLLDQQPWEMMLLRNGAASINIKQAIELIRRRNRDVPLIALETRYDARRMTLALAEGATDVVLPGEDERVALVVQRELINVRERQRRRRVEAALSESEKRCQLLLESSRNAIAYIADGMHIFSNTAYQKLLAFADPDELDGLPMLDVVAADAKDALKKRLRRLAEGDMSAASSAPLQLRTAHGDDLVVELSISPAHYQGEPCLQVTVREEESDPVPAPAVVAQQDLVTGLPNAHHFTELLEGALDEVKGGSTVHALMYLWLDEFDQIKSEVGLAGADLVLTDITSALTSAASSSTKLARFGDDSFVALLPNCTQDEAQRCAQKLRESVKDTLSDIGGNTINCTASVGITMLGETADSAQQMLTQALRAAESARKTHDGDGVSLYQETGPSDVPVTSPITKDDAIIERIQRCLEDNRLILLFQPIISLRGDTDEHYEVFARMPGDVDDAMVAAEQFIPQALRAGLGNAVDRWVVLQSIKLLSVHRAKGHDTRLTINLTVESFADPEFLPWLSVAIRAARMPADALIFQITEPDATAHLKQAKDFTRGIAELHCRSSVSHFGGSINPFASLRHLTVDYIKLDGTLIDDVQADPRKREQIANLIGSLQSQGKLTIVPMVESASLLSSLWQAGANYIQGHYLQEPTTEMNFDFAADSDD